MTCNRFLKISVLAFAGLLFIFMAEMTFGARIEEEARVKTAYIYNFCKYVTWPKAVADDPVDICLFGQDALVEHLPTLEQKKIHSRKIIVQLKSVCSDMTASCCEVLFISKSEKENLADILKTLAGNPVLTVSDIEGFARLGGMIELVRQGNKIRFKINKESADKAGLVISSRLLQLATIVGGEQDK